MKRYLVITIHNPSGLIFDVLAQDSTPTGRMSKWLKRLIAFRESREDCTCITYVNAPNDKFPPLSLQF